jgi:hypothetical protein
LKIRNGNHTRLPIPQTVEIAHFICCRAVRSTKRSPPKKKKGKPLGYFRAYERFGFFTLSALPTKARIYCV